MTVAMTQMMKRGKPSMANPFVPIQKQSKKAQKKANAKRRGTWYGINPVTRVPTNSRAYNRAKTTAAFRRTNMD